MSEEAPTATILVVDDSETNRDLLLRRLRKRGYEVLQADSGEIALRTLQQQTVHLMVLDVMMPGISGLDVLTSVRKTWSALELPVIMATARTDSKDVVTALEMGANDYVTKPLDFPVVLARIENQLRQRAAAVKARPATAEGPAVTSITEEAAPGKVLGGRYRLESLIGTGAFGSVFKARQTDLDRLVAVKVLKAEAARSNDLIVRFQREGIAACRIRHPNAVAILDYGVAPAGPFLVMEMLEGHSLEAELRLAGRLKPPRCAEILHAICGVLAEAHSQGIVHRDIKPGNVFLHSTPQGEMVKVLDFGIAKFVGSAEHRTLTQEGGIIGTPAYMAPERFRGGEPDGKWDVYSLGIMLWQMLAGQLPYPSADKDLLVVAMHHISSVPPSLRALNPNVTAEMEEVVLSAMAKDAAARPGPMALASAFARAVGEIDLLAPPSTTVPPAAEVPAEPTLEDEGPGPATQSPRTEQAVLDAGAADEKVRRKA